MYTTRRILEATPRVIKSSQLGNHTIDITQVANGYRATLNRLEKLPLDKCSIAEAQAYAEYTLKDRAAAGLIRL